MQVLALYNRTRFSEALAVSAVFLLLTGGGLGLLIFHAGADLHFFGGERKGSLLYLWPAISAWLIGCGVMVAWAVHVFSNAKAPAIYVDAGRLIVFAKWRSRTPLTFIRKVEVIKSRVVLTLSNGAVRRIPDRLLTVSAPILGERILAAIDEEDRRRKG